MKLSPFMSVLFTPSVWFTNKGYCAEWDKTLLKLINNKKSIEARTARSIYFGGYSIWIDQDFGSKAGYLQQRPSRHTLCLLKQYLKEN